MADSGHFLSSALSGFQQSAENGSDDRHSRRRRDDDYEDRYSKSSRQRSRSRERSQRDDDSRRSSRRYEDEERSSSRRYDDDDRRTRDSGRDREPASRDSRDRRDYNRDRDSRGDSGRSYQSSSRYNDRSSGGRDYGGRSGGGGQPRWAQGGRGGVDRFPERGGPFREKARSVTPPEGTIPISKRKRPRTGWDVKPAGFEAVTTLQAKLSGRFNLPGQTRPSMPSGYGFNGIGSLPDLPVEMAAEESSHHARHGRRIFASPIMPEANEKGLAEFFNTKLRENGLARDSGLDVQAPDPVILVVINREKAYAFVEFRGPEETKNALSFDGIMYMGHQLTVKRPKDYSGTDATGSIHVPGLVSTQVSDSEDKIFIGGLPSYLNDEQVMELLKSFGELRSFNLVKELSGASKGFAFAEYADSAVTDVACEGLHGMELGDRFLVVQRASLGPGARSNAGGGYGPDGTAYPAPSVVAGASSEGNPTRVLQLLNMVELDDLVDDQDYSDLLEDVKEECSRFGEVIEVRVPRPIKTDQGRLDLRASEAVPNIGKVFVMFDSVDSTKKAMQALAGRQFGGRTVLAAYADEQLIIQS